MKRLPIILLAALILYGCEGKNVKVENISNDGYLMGGEVQTLPVVERDTVDPQWIVIDSLMSKKMQAKDTRQLLFDSRVLLNEKGEIDKIIILNDIDPKIDELMADMLESWKIKPAMKDEKPVKFQAGFTVRRFISGSNTSSTLIGAEVATSLPNNTKYYVGVQQMPEPIGGISAIQKKVVYPEIAKRAGIEGRVYILAYINEKGTVDRTRVLKGIGAGCDEAAMKAVQETKFIPGKQRGKPVKTQVTVPVFFRLN